MTLNQNKIQSLHDNINSLDVQKGMQEAVVSIQKDIFDVFTENTVRVTDKKDIVRLEQGLSQRIDTMKSAINGKSDVDTIKDISVKEAKEHITKLSEQEKTLRKIEHGINQVNTPKTIALAEITPRQLTANLFIQDVVADQTEVKVEIEQKGKCIKTDGDSHKLKIVDTGSGRQIDHEGVIIGRIEKVGSLGWKTKIFAEKTKELGIKEIHLPLTTSKVIELPNVTSSTIGTSTIKKTKTWKVNTEQLQTTMTPASDTPTDIPPTNEPPTEIPPTNNPGSSQEINISAHVMDKESLVKKSIEQDVLEEYQHKYEKRRWPKRFAMYTYARWRQNNRINNRLSFAKNNNDVIETDAKRQLRIASSIGNFAYENDLGLGGDKITKTEIGSNSEVNNIANQYIKGAITRSVAAEQFNAFFKNNPDFQAGMTGTNIMEQLDETALIVSISPHLGDATHPRNDEDYRSIQQKMSLLAAGNPNMKIHGVKISNAVSKPEIDKICDYALAYKNKAAIASLQNITANIKLYKIEKKDTADLTESKLREQNKTRKDKAFAIANAATFGMAGSTRGSMGLKMMAGAGLAAGGVGTLGIVGGVAGMAAALQWMKTYRDYLTEAQKTHEDAMTMGTKELDKRIKELETQIKKHNGIQKTLAFWGFGKHAIRTKQLNILKAVNGKMHQTGAIKPAAFLIQEMQHSSRDRQAVAIAETLARIKMGRELNTNFISGSSRAFTEQERKDLIIQLRQSAQQRAKKVGYEHILPYSEEEEWKDFSAKLLSIPKNNIGSIYQRKCDDLEKNFMLMKEEINKGRKKMARRDAGTNLATSVTVAGVAAGVSAGVQAWNGGSSGIDGGTIQGPHNEYALGQYETPVVDKATGREKAFSNGDKVSFQGEAAVDAVSASSGSFGSLNTEIADVTKLSLSFDSTTQAAVHDALTTELAKVKAEAIKAGADAGNVALTQQRWVDGVEEIVKKLHDAGKTGVTIEQIKFDPSTFNPIDIQTSAAAGSGVSMQDIIDRSVAFEATIGGTTGTWSAGEPLWVVWPGFSNTYAKPGKENDQSDSWSKRNKEVVNEPENNETEGETPTDNTDEGNGETPDYRPVPPITDKEKYRKDTWNTNKNKPFDDDDRPEDTPYGRQDDERGVSPRGREGSIVQNSDVQRHFTEDYPHTPTILNAQEAAEKIVAAKLQNKPLAAMPFVTDENFAMGQNGKRIEEALKQGKKDEAVALLTQTIQDELIYVNEEMQRNGYKKTIESSLKSVNSIFDELGIRENDRAEIPAYENIHIIPNYLFCAQQNKYNAKALGFAHSMNGHIFINYEAIEHGPEGRRSVADKKALLSHILTHEIIHATSTANYHKTRKEDASNNIIENSEKYVFNRRLGALMTRKVYKNGNVYIEERGRALNEGLTESLNLYILEHKLGIDTSRMIQAYPGERNIINKISEKFSIDKKDLYRFLIHRKFGKPVIQKLYGSPVERTDSAGKSYKSYQNPGYITLLMEIMDMEHGKNDDGSLPLSESFVDKKAITITKEQTKNFHPSLINPDGSLKADILQAYPFIKQA